MRVPFRVLLDLSLVLTLGMSLAACAPTDQAPTEAAVQEVPAADADALAGDLLKDWEALKDTMMQLGDAMPAENFGYKPTDELRTFGEQLMHITTSNAGMIARLDAAATAPELGEPVEKADVLAAMATAFDFGSDVLRGKSSAWAQEIVEGPRYLGPSTRARLVYRAKTHTWDEYGVMTVYLRLNGIVPPASR